MRGEFYYKNLFCHAKCGTWETWQAVENVGSCRHLKTTSNLHPLSFQIHTWNWSLVHTSPQQTSQTISCLRDIVVYKIYLHFVEILEVAQRKIAQFFCVEVETVMHRSDIQPQNTSSVKKKSWRWKCHRVLPPVISLRAFLTHYMTGWKIVLYRFAVKRKTGCREKASRCFFWGASMERLRCVRARGDEKTEMAGVNKVHFVVRNNTSVVGEITEGRQYPSNIITPQISLPPSFTAHFQTPPHIHPCGVWVTVPPGRALHPRGIQAWALAAGEEKPEERQRDNTGLCGCELALTSTGVLFASQVCKPFGAIVCHFVNFCFKSS